MPLKFDLEIRLASDRGDNDLAQELTVEQRYFYENLCSDPDMLTAWRQHNEAEKLRVAEFRLQWPRSYRFV